MKSLNISVNKDYFLLSSRRDNLCYFLKRGHLLALLWDRFRWFYFPKFGIIPRFPLTVDVESSFSCQLSCPMCGRRRLRQRDLSGLMDFGLFTKIIDECAAHRVFSVKLSWRGEPLMNPQIVEMVAYAKNKGIRDVSFLTNGGLLTPELSARLIDAGLDWISFSIDGLDNDYDRIRAPIHFSQIVEIVRQFKKCRDDRHRVKPLIRIQGISSVVGPRAAEFVSFWKPLADRIALIADEDRVNASIEGLQDPNFVCQYPFQRLCVSYTGEVVACMCNYEVDYSLGNVKEMSLQNIWEGDKIHRMREVLIAHKRLEEIPGCKTCPSGIRMGEDSVITSEGTKKVRRYLINNGTKNSHKN